MRKIIQITAAVGLTDSSIYALCDDGTVWVYTYDSGEWKFLPVIPQERV
jgi:hypothetical protein